MSSPYPNNQPPYPGSYPNGGWGTADVPPHGRGMPPYPGWGPPAAVPRPAGPEPSSFGRRLAARTIDYVLSVVAAVAFFIAMAGLTVLFTGNSEPSDGEGVLWALLWLFGWGVLLFFYDWLYLVTWGRTIGKMMTGIKVVSAADGGRLTQGQALGRSAFFGLPQTLPGLGLLLSLGESMAALGESSQALHDRATGTIVIRVR